MSWKKKLLIWIPLLIILLVVTWFFIGLTLLLTRNKNKEVQRSSVRPVDIPRNQPEP